jgi:hypothetical protein
MASLQSFSIPGSIFMSFLGGALFGLPVGFCVVTLVRMLPPTITNYPPLPPAHPAHGQEAGQRGGVCA